jgi:hypothetical protein
MRDFGNRAEQILAASVDLVGMNFKLTRRRLEPPVSRNSIILRSKHMSSSAIVVANLQSADRLFGQTNRFSDRVLRFQLGRDLEGRSPGDAPQIVRAVLGIDLMPRESEDQSGLARPKISNARPAPASL